MWKRRAIAVYKRLLVRRAFYRFHRRLFTVSLWGLGILNSESYDLSGESRFLARLPAFVTTAGRRTILDIGAKVGDYAALAKALYPDSATYAFEPHPATFAILEREAARAGFQAFNLAVSDFVGTAMLYNRPGEDSEHASLYRGVIADIHRTAVVQAEVGVTTVDAFVDQHAIDHIDLMKMDAEGSELSILRGARQSLEARRIGAIQFEFNEMHLISRAYLRDFATMLPGYRLFRLLPDGMVRLDGEPPVVQEVFAFQNIVALRGEAPPATGQDPTR